MNVRAYWETPEALSANKRDVCLKQLEIQAISRYIRGGMRVLDVGCGDGETALMMARQHDISIYGVDVSERMVGLAESSFRQARQPFGAFAVQDIRQLDVVADRWFRFDLAYSERCLINLQNWAEQKRAIQGIMGLLQPGGIYVMCEHSREGLDSVNEWRGRLGLPAISPPWHNRYIRDDEIRELMEEAEGFHLAGVEDFSGMYYFLSRVVNAGLAASQGMEPEYDAPINHLAMRLPNTMGIRGQGRIWTWIKSR